MADTEPHIPIWQQRPSLQDEQQRRRATPKHEIEPRMITKEKKDKAKKLSDKEFREAIWKLDEGKSRATGKPLVRGGTMDPHQLGEVDHSIPRSLAPERIYDLSNALLLSKWENRARKIACPRAPEFKLFDYTGPDDRRKPQHFIWRDSDGKVIKETRG